MLFFLFLYTVCKRSIHPSIDRSIDLRWTPACSNLSGPGWRWRFVFDFVFVSQEMAARRHKWPLLRRMCQRLGVRVLSRAYKLETVEPFALEDIVGVFPVVKVRQDNGSVHPNGAGNGGVVGK